MFCLAVIGYAVDGQIVRLGDQIDEDTFKNDPDSLGKVATPGRGGASRLLVEGSCHDALLIWWLLHTTATRYTL